MSRILVRLAVVSSLLVSVAAAGVWVRSYRVADLYGWGRTTSRSSVGAVRGGLCYSRVTCLAGPRPGNSVSGTNGYHTLPAHDAPLSPRNPTFRLPGFSYSKVRTPFSEAFRGEVRCWWVCVLASLAPAAYLVTRGRRPSLPGRCRNCGYDLRATPGRCPECGTVIAGDSTSRSPATFMPVHHQRPQEKLALETAAATVRRS